MTEDDGERHLCRLEMLRQRKKATARAREGTFTFGKRSGIVAITWKGQNITAVPDTCAGSS